MSAKNQTAVIYGVGGTKLTPDEIALFRDTHPYGYILFARNCETPQQIKALVEELHNVSSRKNLPILIDQEGGRVARLKPPHWPKYPPAGVFAAMGLRDLEQAKQAVYLNARLIANDLASLGLTVDCAPLADIPVKGAHDIIGDRAFGHEPKQVIALARAMANGLADGGIVSVLKHIPGHGRAFADSHEELPVVKTPIEELRANDFVPFKALADLPMAMTAHVLYTAIDENNMATLSPKAISIIRNELGFKGLLMSDDISMKAMRGDFTERAKETLAAGCDVVLHCNGDMAEMKAIAKGVAPLTGISAQRAEAAMQGAGKAKPFDVMEARATLDQVLKAAA